LFWRCSTMNRQNLPIHLAIALFLLLLFTAAGQFRKWQQNSRANSRSWRGSFRSWIVKMENPLPDPDDAAGSGIKGVDDSKTEVLVRFRSGVSLERMRSIISTFHDQLEDEVESVKGLVVIEDLDKQKMQSVVDQYGALSEVEYAEPNYEINLIEPSIKTRIPSSPDIFEETTNDTLPNDPRFSEQWALANGSDLTNSSELNSNEEQPRADISASEAWKYTTGSADVVVAVLDSGVDYSHPDLIDNIWTRSETIAPYFDDELGTIDDVHGFNSASVDGDPMDENGHGTHCAGIIGARGNNGIGIAGVNWNVRIMSLKFMSSAGVGTTKSAIECINYCIARKRDGVNVRVINASWGSPQKSRALEDAIREAAEAGILFVAASGNDSTDADRSPHFPSGYRLANVISVAATDRFDHLAQFSNFGLKNVDIAAPGVDILSTWLDDSYHQASGTSMAAPYVSGVAALLLAREPRLTVSQIRKRLLTGATHLEGLSGKVADGARLNAVQAIAPE
ncbi:MAG: S8 family serine peptidase, partial [Pyrinomonadaceae bacterium]